MTSSPADSSLKQRRRVLPVALAALLAIIGLCATVTSILSATTPDRLYPERNPARTASRDVGAAGPVAAYPNCRFGVGGNVSGYPVAELNVGWHMDWSSQAAPARPNGAEYVQVIRLQEFLTGYAFTPPTATLYMYIDQNPGATWLIGNEPDSPWQDNLLPETYARAYHHLYHLVKQRDPSARVGAGAIVQPTPLRFEYLNKVLNTYQQLYGERLPADLWNIHTYILREIDSTDPEAYPHGPYEVWGAYIPPGSAATRGILYTKADMFSLSILRQRLIDFRSWMRDRGYRDQPLVITEFGELFPYPPDTPGGQPYYDEKGVPITEQRVADFMTGAFGVLRGLSDATIGYPPDENRLVQRWLWYSVDSISLGGALYDPSSSQRRLLGSVFQSYTQAISPSVDLLAVRVLADPPAISDTGRLETTTLKALLSNVGNISITPPITVVFYSGTVPYGAPIGSPRVITSALNGCAAALEVSITWPNLRTGAHPMYVKVDPANAIGETNENNNVASGFALIATDHVYLPVTEHGYSSGP